MDKEYKNLAVLVVLITGLVISVFLLGFISGAKTTENNIEKRALLYDRDNKVIELIIFGEEQR